LKPGAKLHKSYQMIKLLAAVSTYDLALEEKSM
jgi:hypothetical protein